VKTRALNAVHAWLLLLPAMALLALFTHWPVVATVFDSLWSTPRPRRPAVFVGINNYRAIANIWLFFYTPQYGLLEQLLSLFGARSHNWLGTPDTALACVTVVAIWKEAGFFMIFYLAALQQISPTLAEAAALEGASRWTYFRRVQFPLLMPTTLFVLVNAVINAFRTVDHIIVMTRGGPDNTTTLLLYYIYEVGFKFWDTTYAAALTVVLLAVLATASLGQYLFLERRVHYR
jgi:sn-glycerol 3-phosphate transport system permease protein